VLPPDINESDKDFNVIDERIRFGLAAVKNVGGAALDSIIEEREREGGYKSIEDFCARVDSRRVNKRVIESLIKAGAFDSLQIRRSQLFAIMDQAMEQAQAAQRDRQSGQMALFGLMPEAEADKAGGIPLPDIPEWNKEKLLAAEKEMLGFYLSGHPLDKYRLELRELVDDNLAGIAASKHEHQVRIGGLIRVYKEHKSKKKERMAFITLEDLSGSIEVIVFPRIFAECAELLSSNEPLIIQGRLQTDEENGGAKVIAETVDSLPGARQKFIEKTSILLAADDVSRPKLEGLKQLMQQFYGPCPVSITIHFDRRGEVDIEPAKDMTIRPCRDFRDGVSQLMAQSQVIFHPRQVEASTNGRKQWRKKG
jgi:DNA polymerase-3 subunit alpha